MTVYVFDTGVNKFHNEFAPGGARVQSGFNASGDLMPADDPCVGFALAPTGVYANIESIFYRDELIANGHGTAVASALGGRRVGIAKNVTIVPIKVSRCDFNSARYRISAHFYPQNETMWRTTNGGYSGVVLYRALNGGTTAGTEPPSWPTIPGQTIVDGGVTWQVATPAAAQTTQMMIDGLNWILSANNPGPKSNAIVTMSTYRLWNEAGVAGPTGTLEAAIRDLLANNITVIASANNQNGNACDTSPGRMSINNPDTAVANDVITVGGSMIVNRPWSVDISDVPGSDVYEADGPKAGGGYYGVEPAYDQTKAVRDARWICGAGDSSIACSNLTPICTVNPSGGSGTNLCAGSYYGFQGGSNAGPCVTLFAPAKNVFVATPSGANGYRDARLRAGWASGTSFSAPIVAGFAARILQSNPTYTPAQVRSVLLGNSVGTLDPATLNTYDYNGVEITGTPNKMLRLGDVNITSQPSSTVASDAGATPLTVTASGTSTVSYQWYEVNAGFDFATYKNGAHSSVPIAGATSNTFNAPASAVARAYWVRVTNSCGSADSDIAVVVPKPGPASNVNAVAAGTSVTVTWSAGSGAEKYLIQRKVAGQPWTEAGQVNAPTLSFTETPLATGGMVVYRVVSAAGAAYLPPESLALSLPSNNDFANVNSYEVITIEVTPIKAQHQIELRQAVNALCDAIGAPPEYQPGDLQLSSLLGKVVEDEDFTSLLTRINNARGFAGVGPASFTETPVAGMPVKRDHLQNLRDALR